MSEASLGYSEPPNKSHEDRAGARKLLGNPVLSQSRNACIVFFGGFVLV